MNIPKLDSLIGMDLYSTSTLGTGGSIKKRREDFLVRETLSKKTLSKITTTGGYAVYELEKDGIDTNHALAEVQKKTGTRLKALGLKDSRAVTSQYVCATSKATRITKYDGSKFSIKQIGFSQRPLTAKDMVGNRFSIRVSDSNTDVEIFDEYDKILNYFGYQRFGSGRPVSHRIGKHIMMKNYDSALQTLLSETSEYDTKDRTELRKQLADVSKFAQTFEKIPHSMDLERMAVSELVDGGTAESAIRALPSRMRRFFVQSFQSYIFNKTITMAKKTGEELTTPQKNDVCFNSDGILGRTLFGEKMQAIAIPLVGHSYYKKTRFDHYIQQILQEEEISARDFFTPHMQETSIEGGFRRALLVCSDCTAKDGLVEFTLSRGSYATVVLREIIKPENPIMAGFS
ncbi:MAG: tRNA pseudouridine synthase D [Cenarchaeum symbiont of Oopsacas minuta]|nr:tRNA pseudouridine synthase D [Cenarchaeum symbiont of Oopsacas minuta]